MKRKIILAVLAMAGVWSAGAQNFAWDLRFDTKFVNREYDALSYLGTVSSLTGFNVRIVPALGIALGGSHRIMAGVSYTLEMGAPANRDPEPVIFYNYRSPKYGLWAGKFERRRLVGSYSRAIYIGGQTFKDNIVEGFALQYTPRKGELELVLDWDGMKSPTVRESFRILSAGEYNPFETGPMRWLTGSYGFDMYHLASREGMNDGVVDHILVDVSLGAALERVLPWFDRLTLKAGWTNSFDRERKGTNRWLTPGGVTFEVNAGKKKVGIRNLFYSGEPLFPFWHTYGNRVYRGDGFFLSDKINNTTTVYWHPELTRGVSLILEAGVQTDGRHIALQQIMWVGITLDESFFRRK